MKQALLRQLGHNIDEEEDDDDMHWTLADSGPPEEVKRWQRSLLRRYALLIVLFFMFGAYEADYFMVRKTGSYGRRAGETIKERFAHSTHDICIQAGILCPVNCGFNISA